MRGQLADETGLARGRLVRVHDDKDCRGELLNLTTVIGGQVGSAATLGRARRGGIRIVGTTGGALWPNYGRGANDCLAFCGKYGLGGDCL